MNTNTQNRSTGSSLLAGIALAMVSSSLALPVAAEPFSPAPQKVVSYADLDLSRSEGATTLYGRLRMAAKQVCGDRGRRVEEIARWEACYQHAMDEAVASVDKPSLTALHIARQGDRAKSSEPTVATSQ